MADSDSNSDAGYDLDWRHGGPHEQKNERVLTEHHVNMNGPMPNPMAEFSKQRKKDAKKQSERNKPRDLVNLDTDSDSQAKASPKGALGTQGRKEVVDLSSSEDDDDDKRPAKWRPLSRMPTVMEDCGGLAGDRAAPSGQNPGKRPPAPWSPPRPELSDGPTGSSGGIGKGECKRKVSADAKGKKKVGWSDDEGGQRDGEESSDDSEDEVDLINVAPAKQKAVPKQKGSAGATGGAKRQRVDASGADNKMEDAERDGGLGHGVAGESKGEEGLEGLDEKEKKRRLAELKKRRAAQEKALKAEQREKQRQEQRQEKERLKQERQEARKQAAEEKRAQREQEKQQRAEQRDAYQKLSGKDALANCTVRIDQSLIGRDQLGVMLTLELQSKQLKFECCANAMDFSITWRRVHYRSRVGTQDEFESQSQAPESQPDSQVEGEEVDVPYVVLVYSAAVFCDMVRTGSLWTTLEAASVCHPGWTVCLLVPELRKYIKQRKAEDYKKAGVAGHVAWVDPGVDEALARLCVHYDRVRSCTPKDDNEAAEHIANLTRGHAEAPYKKASTVVGTFGGGNHLKPSDKARLKKWPWLKGLTLLDGVSINVAEAIKRRYPTLRSLLDAYHHPTTTAQEKAALLKDLPRTIGFGEGSQPGQESSRRVGPKLSEKVHRFFTARDPDMMIEEIGDKG